MKNHYRELSKAEALAKLAEIKKALFDLRFRVVLGHVENPLEKRNLRRQVSRLNTIISEFDQGIRKV